jgi:hypothetical protein
MAVTIQKIIIKLLCAHIPIPKLADRHAPFVRNKTSKPFLHL